MAACISRRTYIQPSLSARISPLQSLACKQAASPSSWLTLGAGQSFALEGFSSSVALVARHVNISISIVVALRRKTKTLVESKREFYLLKFRPVMREKDGHGIIPAHSNDGLSFRFIASHSSVFFPRLFIGERFIVRVYSIAQRLAQAWDACP